MILYYNTTCSYWLSSVGRLISWPWEITFVPLWIVLCISLVGVLYTIIFAGVILRLPDMNHDHRRTSTNSALGKNPLFFFWHGPPTGPALPQVPWNG
jgi:hypothetical protein